MHRRAAPTRPSAVRGALCRALLVLAGCAAPPALPIAWEPERRVPAVVAPGATMAFADGIPVMRAPVAPLRWPDDTLACRGSFVGAAGRGDTVWAAWRTARDSTTRVLAAWSPNAGVSWGTPTPVGAPARDRGCGGAAPAAPIVIATDTATGATWLAFYADQPEAGLYAARLARQGPPAAPWLAIAAGRPVAAAIAVQRDTLVMVLESPAQDGSVWLALWAGASHIPAMRERLTGAGVRAMAPGAAFDDGRLGVAWVEAARPGSGPIAVARIGRLGRTSP
jgi:hypothetical protein